MRALACTRRRAPPPPAAPRSPAPHTSPSQRQAASPSRPVHRYGAQACRYGASPRSDLEEARLPKR
eukprot:6197859-Pleurochrysis_carterae.AAC.2